MRVNARLDEATQQQLEYLTEITGHSVSRVVRDSVAQRYTLVKQNNKPSRFLALIGTGSSGRSDVSSHVKEHMTDILERKLGLPPSQTLPAPQPVKRAKASKR